MPTLSILVANYNGAAHIEACLDSILHQTFSDLEVIVADDASTDDSCDRVRRFAKRDGRVILLHNNRSKGPAGARNTALAQARGAWVAVVDSDDVIFVERFSQLIAKAERDGADIAADDLLVFEEGGASSGRLLKGWRARQETWVTPQAYLDENHLFASGPTLGLLKPIFRRSALEGVTYDEGLRIAEDFDLVMRLLGRGARFRIYPEVHYLYRKHPASISARLAPEDVDRMIDSQASLVSAGPHPAAVLRAFDRRLASLKTAAAFGRLVEALKARRLAQALRIGLARPGAALLLRLPLLARLPGGRGGRPAVRPPGRASCCVISRQRVVGGTNGSSAYLLAIARAITELDIDVHLLQPSPATFGRWPVLALRPEMKVFSSIRLRGSIPLGALRIATDPSVVIAALRTIAGRALARFKIRPPWLQVAPAPYAIGAPWTSEDLLFVARHAPRISDMVVFDYAFQTPASPYVLRAQAPRFTVMHDLFSSRERRFSAVGAADSVDSVSSGREYALLAGADVTIAIQKEEAAEVATALPGHRVITCMMPVESAPAGQVGEDDLILFVGSNAAANVSGLTWFLDQVLPLIRQRRPATRLVVAGSVAGGFPADAFGAEFQGVVSNLAPLYAQAGVVISPLLAGSGLKIKLVEAMAKGKAIVATSTTLQGVEAEVGDAVRIADDPGAFAQAVLDLAADQNLRRRLGQEALEVARGHFSSVVCMKALRDAIAESLAAEPGT